MTTTLTERYIAATVKSIAPGAQDDVRAELGASIDDAIEARLEQGEPREAAEREVLIELGDPGILAASYADRPLHLIGPRFYLTWWRLLKLLLIIVPPIAMAGVGLGKAISGGDVGAVIGAMVVVAISTVVHIGFWTTLVFVILERTNSETTLPEWDLDQLPEPADQGAGRQDAIASLIFLVIGVGAVFWDAFIGFFPTGGDPIPLLNPGLWPWGMTVFFALIIAEALLSVAVYRTRRWTVGAAVINTLLAVAFAVWSLALLVRGELINPEFLSFVFTGNGVQDDTMQVLTIITGFCLVAFPVWDIVDGWIKTLRSRRA
jgi:hypothetical protein